jgi:hypothetical protein
MREIRAKVLWNERDDLWSAEVNGKVCSSASLDEIKDILKSAVADAKHVMKSASPPNKVRSKAQN